MIEHDAAALSAQLRGCANERRRAGDGIADPPVIANRTVAGDRPKRSNVGYDGRHAARACLDEGVAAAFVVAPQNEEIDRGIPGGHVAVRNSPDQPRTLTKLRRLLDPSTHLAD